MEKGDCVLTSLNTYFPNKKLSGALLKTLRQQYRKVYFWIQNPADYAYAHQLDRDVIFLNPTLAALDDFLASQPGLDYVGNRLHAGIRALQHGIRTLIVEVDNRASMMGADFGSLRSSATTSVESLARLLVHPRSSCVYHEAR